MYVKMYRSGWLPVQIDVHHGHARENLKDELNKNHIDYSSTDNTEESVLFPQMKKCSHGNACNCWNEAGKAAELDIFDAVNDENCHD